MEVECESGGVREESFYNSYVASAVDNYLL